MPTNTFKYIAKSELSGSAASVTFNNLGSYKDLAIYYSARSNANDWASQVRMNLNGSSSNIQINMTRGISSAAQAAQFTLTYGAVGYCAANQATANVFGTGWIYIPDYRSTTLEKIAYADATTFGVIGNGDAVSTSISFIQSPDSAAITDITLFPDSSSFAQYSSFWVYGID